MIRDPGAWYGHREGREGGVAVGGMLVRQRMVGAGGHSGGAGARRQGEGAETIKAVVRGGCHHGDVVGSNQLHVGLLKRTEQVRER